MIESIKELIVMYAPTVLMVIATVLNYVKVLKGLKQEDLKAELERTKKCSRHNAIRTKRL